jgi:hypothetical protein
MTFILPSFGASAISAVPGGGGGGGGAFTNTYSLEFDGTDDVMQTGVAYATTWSASVWIKPNHTSGSNGAIFSDGGSRRAYIYYDGTNYSVYLRQGSSPFVILTSTGNAIHDTWTHMAFTRDSATSTATMYINGSQVATATDGGDTANKQKPANIGCINTTGLFPFNGKMDEFGWWDGTALSSSQITNIYRGEDDGGSGGTNGIPGDLDTFNPTGWWRMGDTGSDYGTATITNAATGSNSGGSSINGTIVNGSSGNTSPTYSTDIPVAPLSNTYSVDLDGSNDMVIYNATANGVNSGKTALGTFTGSMSFVLWFKHSDASSYETLISSRHPAWNASTGASGNYLAAQDGVQGKFEIDIAFGATLRAWVQNSNARPLTNTSAGSVTLNAWNFLAYVFDQSAGTHVVYVGDESTTPSVGSTLSNSATMEDFANGFNIGDGQQPTLQGLVDEFAIFDGKALSSSEVATIWNSGEAFDYSSDASLNPVGLFRMGDDDGGTGTSISNSGSGSDSADAINGASFVSGAGNTPGN